MRGPQVILKYQEQGNYLIAHSILLIECLFALRHRVEIKKVPADIFIISQTIDFDSLTRGNPRCRSSKSATTWS